VKISNYNLKRNARTNDFEIHINKRTKLDEPTASEVNFDFKPAPQPQLTPVKEIVDIYCKAIKHNVRYQLLEK